MLGYRARRSILGRVINSNNTVLFFNKGRVVCLMMLVTPASQSIKDAPRFDFLFS